MYEITSPGPAPTWLGPPEMAVPAPEKIPAPMMAPIPREVSCHIPSERRSPGSTSVCGSTCSERISLIGFLRKIWDMGEAEGVG
jgi:hypothetical protein